MTCGVHGIPRNSRHEYRRRNASSFRRAGRRGCHRPRRRWLLPPHTPARIREPRPAHVAPSALAPPPPDSSACRSALPVSGEDCWPTIVRGRLRARAVSQLPLDARRRTLHPRVCLLRPVADTDSDVGDEPPTMRLQRPGSVSMPLQRPRPCATPVPTRVIAACRSGRSR